MNQDYWQQQSLGKPLFPNILWSRPENRLSAGKLLIIGGNLNGFASVGQAYQVATKSGIGITRVVLPQALKKTVGRILENCEFAAGTPSGGFARDALGEFIDLAAWSDAVLLSGDFGRSSETAVLLEKFVTEYSGPLILTKDAVDYFLSNPSSLLNRNKTILVISTGQLQKISQAAKVTQPMTPNLDLLRMVEALHEFSMRHSAFMIVQHLESTIVACSGKVSSTRNGASESLWQVETAARTAVLWIQNTNQPFESLTTAQILDVPNSVSS